MQQTELTVKLTYLTKWEFKQETNWTARVCACMKTLTYDYLNLFCLELI